MSSALANSRSGARHSGKSNDHQRDRWNPSLILQTIRKLHRQKKPMWSRQIRETNGALHSAAIHWFGSYRKAVAAAGIDYRSIQRIVPGRWSPQNVQRELRRLHRNKSALHHAALERENPALMLAAYRYFGSYSSAVSAAGLNYDHIRVRPMPSWDKKRVIRRIKELEKNKSGLWKRAVRRVDPYLDRAADRCFGSYQRAVRLSGISADALKPPPYRFWSPQRILDELQTTYQKNPLLLKPCRLVGKKQRLLRACRRRYGSYRQALDAAGIPYGEVVMPPSMTAEQITAKLSDLFERGKDLRYSHLRDTNRRLLDAARRVFGSYQKAVLAAGLNYPPAPPMRHWTAQLVLKTLKDLHRKNVDLRYRHFRKARLPLFEAARHYFGTYLGAIKLAGIDYSEVVSEQLARELPARSTSRR
jgi:molybdenum-dependent DNA-binding transcriptional regulator ModE